MVNLMIVDDEHSVVESLSTSIPWESCGVRDVYKAYSAKEAIQLMSMHSVHIVITDIRMPGLSGLDLARTIQQRWKQTKCIILSGHASFDYAKQALQHGTIHYLLKPVSDEELIAAVQAAGEIIASETEQVMKHHQAMYAMKSSMQEQRGELLQDMLLGHRYDERILGRRLEQLEMEISPGAKTHVLLVRYEDYQENPSAFELMKYAITNVAEEILSPSFYLYPTHDAHDCLVFLLSPRSSVQEMEPLLVRLGERLLSNVRQYLRAAISLSFSRTGRFPDQLPQLYQQAMRAFRSPAASASTLHISTEEMPQGIRLQSLPAMHEPPTLPTLMKAGRWNDARNKVEQILEELSDSVFPEHVYAAFHYFAASFSEMAHSEGQPISDVLGEEYQQLLKDGYRVSMRGLSAWSRRVISRLAEQREQQGGEAGSAVIRQVRQWIDQHLNGDVSLQAIAGIVNLHPVYLSKMYKQWTGEGLSDYVVRIRMERAVHLLKHSNLKIYEIGEEVGYGSTPYFIQVFRKHHGLTPQDYRNG
ncbi:response regulator [Paenibacillus sp. JX-17]|uniref:Response regulator n=1 Tax=Paenibacillus lacisoli TaxID=3064525 RepID=A0ABT9CF55_9BACL|nr:response regulator [Paenibacillus sp. JX-17]MDO7907905.1 response regulator [Paenibacillus sp. JX-17]